MPLTMPLTQAAVSAFTGAENYVAYSPTCLTPDSGPEGQASTAVALGLLTPCVATAVAALLWAARCEWAGPAGSVVDWLVGWEKRVQETGCSRQLGEAGGMRGRHSTG